MLVRQRAPIKEATRRMRDHQREQPGMALALPSLSSSEATEIERHRATRYARYRAVKQLQRQGVSQQGIARTLAMSHNTVRRYVRAETFPERAHEYVRRAGTSYFAMLPLLLPGNRRFWPPVAFTQKHAISGLNLAMYWAPAAAEPWYLITTDPTCHLACASYQKRFRIEEMFKDFKNTGRGFGLELTGLQHADRLARLLLALALVYTWLLVWGAYVIATGQQKLVDNVRKSTLSVFQTGLRFVMRLWQRGQLMTFHWHLSMLTKARN